MGADGVGRSLEGLFKFINVLIIAVFILFGTVLIGVPTAWYFGYLSAEPCECDCTEEADE